MGTNFVFENISMPLATFSLKKKFTWANVLILSFLRLRYDFKFFSKGAIWHFATRAI